MWSILSAFVAHLPEEEKESNQEQPQDNDNDNDNDDNNNDNDDPTRMTLLVKRLTTYQERIGELEFEHKELKKQLAQSEHVEEMQEMYNTLNSSKQRIRDLEYENQQIVQYNTKDSLTEALEDAQDLLQATRAVQDELEETLLKKEEIIVKKEQQINTLQPYTTRSNVVQELTVQLENSEKAIVESQELNTTLCTALTKLGVNPENILNYSDEEQRRMEMELTQLQHLYNTQGMELEKANVMSSSHTIELQSTVNSSLNRIFELESEIQVRYASESESETIWSQQKASLQAAYERVSETLVNKTKEHEEMHAQLSELLSTKATLEETVHALEKNMRQMQEQKVVEMETVQVQVSEMQSQISSHKEEMEHVRNEGASWHMQWQELEQTTMQTQEALLQEHVIETTRLVNEMQDLQTSVMSIKEEREEFNRILHEKDMQTQVVQKEVEGYLYTISQMENSSEALQQELSDVQDSLPETIDEAIEEETKKFQVQINDLETKLKQSHVMLQQQSDEFIHQKEVELQVQKDTVAEKQLEVDALMRSNQEMQGEIQSVHEKLNASESSMLQLQQSQEDKDVVKEQEWKSEMETKNSELYELNCKLKDISKELLTVEKSWSDKVDALVLQMKDLECEFESQQTVLSEKENSWELYQTSQTKEQTERETQWERTVQTRDEDLSSLRTEIISLKTQCLEMNETNIAKMHEIKVEQIQFEKIAMEKEHALENDLRTTSEERDALDDEVVSLVTAHGEIRADNKILIARLYRTTEQLSHHIDLSPEDADILDFEPPNVWKLLDEGMEKLKYDLEQVSESMHASELSRSFENSTLFTSSS